MKKVYKGSLFRHGEIIYLFIPLSIWVHYTTVPNVNKVSAIRWIKKNSCTTECVTMHLIQCFNARFATILHVFVSGSINDFIMKVSNKKTEVSFLLNFLKTEIRYSVFKFRNIVFLFVWDYFSLLPTFAVFSSPKDQFILFVHFFSKILNYVSWFQGVVTFAFYR